MKEIDVKRDHHKKVGQLLKSSFAFYIHYYYLFVVDIYRVALFFKILFLKVILHNIKRLSPKTLKNHNFFKNKKNHPFEDCLFWQFGDLVQFQIQPILVYIFFFQSYFIKVCQYSISIQICPYGYTLVIKSFISSFCTFAPPCTFSINKYGKFENLTLSGHSKKSTRI